MKIFIRVTIWAVFQRSHEEEEMEDERRQLSNTDSQPTIKKETIVSCEHVDGGVAKSCTSVSRLHRAYVHSDCTSILDCNCV